MRDCLTSFACKRFLSEAKEGKNDPKNKTYTIPKRKIWQLSTHSIFAPFSFPFLYFFLSFFSFYFFKQKNIFVLISGFDFQIPEQELEKHLRVFEEKTLKFEWSNKMLVIEHLPARNNNSRQRKKWGRKYSRRSGRSRKIVIQNYKNIEEGERVERKREKIVKFRH